MSDSCCPSFNCYRKPKATTTDLQMDNLPKKFQNDWLLQACIDGNSEEVQSLIEARTMIDATDNDGRTPLHIACEGGHDNVVKVILSSRDSFPDKKQKMLNATDNDGRTPLHIACEGGHDNVVKVILSSCDSFPDKKKQKMLNATDNDGRTPLHIACLHDHDKVVKEILSPAHSKKDKKKMLQKLDCDRRTPLHIACLRGHDSIVREILDLFPDKKQKMLNATDNDGHTPLHIACEGGHDNVVKVILSSCDSFPDKKKQKVLYATDNDGRTSLHIACEGGHDNIVKVILSSCDSFPDKKQKMLNATDNDGRTPLHIACEGGHESHESIVKCLIEKGADCCKGNSEKRMPLHIACLHGHDKVVKEILSPACSEEDKKKMLQKLDCDRRTPLHIACLHGRDKVVKEILSPACSEEDKKKMLQKLDCDRRTPLHIACLHGHDKVVKEILSPACSEEDKKKMLQKLDCDRRTPLYIACLHGHDKVVREILSPACSEEDKQKMLHYDGRTLLHIACEGGRDNIVKEILSSCDSFPDKKQEMLNAIDCDGYTPLHVACEQGHAKVVSILIQNGADPTISSQKDSLYRDLMAKNTRISVCGRADFGKSSEKMIESLWKNEPDAHYLLSCCVKRKNTTCKVKHSSKFFAGFTPLHVAAKRSFVNILEDLVKKVPDTEIDHTDTYGRTALHLACQGHTETVKLLLECKAKVNVIDKNKRTPLHFACIKGREQVVKLLLEKEAEINKCDKDGLNPLEVAVEEGHEDAAMAIVKSDKWKEALRNHKVVNRSDGIIRRILSCCKKEKDNGTDLEASGESNAYVTQFTTPMRRIIKKMPDVAKVIFDNCCETEKSPYDPDYEITCNYEFIDDFDQRGFKYLSQNHCLNILADSPSAGLLSHQLARTLLNHKWNTYGQRLYYLNAIFYFLFVILQTSFALSVHSPSSGKCIEVFGNTNDTFIDCFPEESFVPQKFTSFAGPILIVCSIVMILRELVQFFWFRLQYFKVTNFVEVLLFIFTIIIASVRSSECYCTRPWQWRIGVIAVFLGWIALTHSIRKLPVVGIYVVMFIRICCNFMKVSFLALLLISAFAFPFYMTFYDAQDRSEGIRTPFITPWRSVFKTIIMTMGEYNMDSVLQQNNERNSADAQYPVFAFSLIIIFLILMPILFLNLLIGLAVGDTGEIQKSADTDRQILKVKFTLPIEEVLRKLPIIGKILKNELENLKRKKVKPNGPQSCRKKLLGYLTWTQWTDEHYKIEPLATVADVKNQNRPLAEEVKDLRSSMDQLLAIVNSMNERIGGGKGTGGGGLEGGLELIRRGGGAGAT